MLKAVKNDTAGRDYLAVCLIGSGSSFGRASTREGAVRLCKRSLERDWGPLFDLDGVKAHIGLYDVTGHDDLYWDHRGVHPEGEPRVIIDLLEQVDITLSVPKRQRR